MIDLSFSAEIYTVSQLNQEARTLLEKKFATLWVEGEISNFAVPGSGHWYFSLKDANAQVRCAMFRPQNRRLNWQPADGAHVLIRARVSLYEGRGEFQLLVEHIEDVGLGRLRQAFEVLKKKLADEGLFDPTTKKPLPPFPSSIGVITSPTGAALQDILSVLGRRFPSAPVYVYGVQVQGEGAAPAIVQALAQANREKQCDVLILARGGGSLEDLWSFNDERVARAIHRSVVPVVSGVGHETDITIADFVADFRAPTPSVAAESVTPDREEWLRYLEHAGRQLAGKIRSHLQRMMQHLDWQEKHLQHMHPIKRLYEMKQQLDHLESVLIRLQKENLALGSRTLAVLTARLDALSPLAVLQRGFAVAFQLPMRTVLKDAGDISLGSRIEVRLQKGQVFCTVDDVKQGSSLDI